MADVAEADLAAAEAKLAALNEQIATLESGTVGATATDGDVLASLRELRTTLAKETEEANATAASRDKLAEEVAALETDNGKLEYQIAHLKKALAEEPAF